MAQTVALIVVTLASFFFFIQLASGQTISTACEETFNTFNQNIGQCTGTSDNPTVICDQPCRGYYEDVLNDCGSDLPVCTYVHL